MQKCLNYCSLGMILGICAQQFLMLGSNSPHCNKMITCFITIAGLHICVLNKLTFKQTMFIVCQIIYRELPCCYYHGHDLGDQLGMLSSTSRSSGANAVLENNKLRRHYFILATSLSDVTSAGLFSKTERRNWSPCSRVIQKVSIQEILRQSCSWVQQKWKTVVTNTVKVAVYIHVCQYIQLVPLSFSTQ